MRNLNVVNINAADASVDQNGTVVSGAQLFALSMQAVSTGSSTGTVKIQFSNDVVDPTNVPVPTNWSDLTGQSIAIGAAAVVSLPKFDVCYAWLRAVYTHNNGSAGTITVTLCRGGA
jgi:hypothetical protein